MDSCVKIECHLRCYECERVFDLCNETDSEEWFFGHDCES
jgi:hypothetical protein